MSRINFSITKTISKWGKIAMIAIITMFIAIIVNAQVTTAKRQALQQSIATVYPTKDWVIADFVVTDLEFGAKARRGLTTDLLSRLLLMLHITTVEA